MVRMMQLLGVIGLLSVPSLALGEPELAPPPRLVERHVQIQDMVGGYQILLTRKATEKLSCALGAVGDGRPYTEIVQAAINELNDPDASRKMELVAFIIRSQAPTLKKSLDDHMGANGAVIKVFGVENKNLEPPPLAKALGEAFLPPKVKERVKTGMKVINTTPLVWKVEERK